MGNDDDRWRGILSDEGSKRALLSDLQVLDLADEKVEFCSKLLADMGAQVIKIENPGGNPSRQIGPFLKESSKSKNSISFFYAIIYQIKVN